ncbi:MAG: hypothetical protein JWO20_740 [Candidatus Angelobacter sp.]|jgi:hypothetical protein|nr:hypothetical protein [Candidatus Angelobacter sp.]
MKTKTPPDHIPSNSIQDSGQDVPHAAMKDLNRRSFLRNSLVAGAAVTAGAVMLESIPSALAQEGHGHLTRGDAAILRWLAAAEIIETDLWQQYNELGGIQDAEVPGGSGSQSYANAIKQLDGDMDQYIHDNTEDELSHETFINAYLTSNGASPVSLDQFRTLPSSKATGAQQIGRLTNLTQLTVDTTWWTRYRSRTANPDLGDTFPPAIPSLAVGQHPGIPRTDSDLTDPNFLQAIANTAGFHFANIEVGGASMYPGLAQRVTSVEVLRILLSIGGTEITHFQTWHDKAGNAPPLTAMDPVTGVKVTFPDLNSPPFGGEDFQTNLIMPELTAFLSRKLPACSIIRPTSTRDAAKLALQGFMSMGVFIGQSPAFFELVNRLAVEADDAKRGTS